MPARFVRKTQCIELCRGEGHKFAVENTQSKECHCLKNDPDKILSASAGVPDACASKDNKVSPPYGNIHISETMIDMFQIYSVSASEPSPSCDHLAFVKHVFYWWTYKLSNDVFVQCRSYQGTSQKDTKLARKLLMLNDEKTSDEPDKGFKIKKNSGSFEELWNIATASYDWTTLTGIDTGTSGDEIIIETQPARTFMVWGISFHKEQFELRNPNGLSLQMAYNYYKDVNTGAYGADDMRNPTNLEDGKHTFTINLSDLDDLGNYYFNDADGNPLV